MKGFEIVAVQGGGKSSNKEICRFLLCSRGKGLLPCQNAEKKPTAQATHQARRGQNFRKVILRSI